MSRVEGIYIIAERIVKIDSIHTRVHKSCQKYAIGADSPKVSDEVESIEETTDAITSVSSPEILNKKPDIYIHTTKEDIEYEKSRSKSDEIFPDDYYEELAVHRKLSTAMLDFDTFLFHGSCVAVDGKAYIFAAPSGTGKSTHVRLWRQLLGDRAVMVNDDKPYIRVTDNGAIVYGTPFNGKHHLDSNINVPLDGICVLERGQKNHIEKVRKEDVYAVLLQQTYRPNTPSDLQKTLALLDKLTFCVNLYKLSCNMEPDAARVSYEAIHGKSDDQVAL